MRLLDITEAQHFCRPLPAYVPGMGQSLAAFHNTLRVTHLTEGTTYFNVHRISLLNAVERWILLGTAGYRRALDMFIPSNAPWAHVTLYYSSFFAANAILGMFGVWTHFQRLIDVDLGTPNNQVFRINRRAQSPSGYSGSHQVFWDFFYEGCNAISPWVPAQLQFVTTPVNNDRAWQISARNEINYDTFVAFNAAILLANTFNPKRLRTATGPLAQQLEVTEGMLKVAIYFADSLGLSSFAFEGLGTGKRSKILRSLVTKAPPGLFTQSVLQELLQ
jgi:hypothetical protein